MDLCLCYVVVDATNEVATGDGRLGLAQLFSFWPGVCVHDQPSPQNLFAYPVFQLWARSRVW